MEWISVKDRLPEVGQIVDIWRMHDTEWLQTVLSLKGTQFAKDQFHETDYNGYRDCNYKYEIKHDDIGILNVFIKCTNRYLTEFDNYERLELLVEDEQVTHWMPLPEPPKD